MNYEEVKAAWNAKADEHNDWTVLGADEMVEFAISIEREECAKHIDVQHLCTGAAFSEAIRSKA